MKNTKEKVNCSLRTAGVAIKTLKVRNRQAAKQSAAALPKRRGSRRWRESMSKIPKLHYVEPRKLPSETYCVRRKIYTKIRATGHGIPVTDLGSLYVAKVTKGIYDAVISTHQLCCHVYTEFELKHAKHAVQILQKFISRGGELFEQSVFVRQSLRVISITLRLSERSLRLQGRPR